MSNGDNYTVNNYGGNNATGTNSMVIAVTQELDNLASQKRITAQEKQEIIEQINILNNEKALPEEKEKAKNILTQFSQGIDGISKLVQLIDKFQDLF